MQCLTASGNHRTGVVNYGNGISGAQGSKTNLAYEESSSSDTETEIDELDPYLLDFSSEIYNRISEQACKTLKQTALLSQSYHKSCIPFLLQMSKRPKKTTFSIELQTFSRSKTIIVTDGDSTKKIVLLICTYAIRKNLKPSQREIDECLRKKIPLHNQFVSNQLHDLSKATLEKNKAALKEFGMPSWSDGTWESFKKTFLISPIVIRIKPYSHVTNPQGLPSCPPQIFEDTHYDFLNLTAISILGRPLESSNNDVLHHTIGPPDALKTTKASTHIGFSFQISHRLVSRALKLNKLSKAEKKKRTTNQAERFKIKH
ncbi:hypothetical protein MJO28_016019 [Puccinia striiformis f. sp. tritici]|uniref:Uncharacterized protein n=1 Tax=Puccinia striiformis f. sp. tritici TaxID=168172 RepID=A0ACC0DQ98_9BASI|nr:hypothetical protein MJO28_016019 [Puccinia striiformis f. sp. tritici]